MEAAARTPWQKVHEKFGLRPAELARLLGRHRSKLSRALASDTGLIAGRDQVALQALALEKGVDLTPGDLTPSQEGRHATD